jgi:hypothetical protein
MNTTVSITREGAAPIMTVEGALPSPSMAENERYPWSQWQVGYQEKMLYRAAQNLLQAQANLDFVRQVVAARSDERAAKKAAAVLAAIPAAVPVAEATQVPTVVEANAQPAEVPVAAGGGRAESAAPSPVHPRGNKRSTKRGK